ncbi:hypothetical protein PGB90_007002 [Kerria lacca]
MKTQMNVGSNVTPASTFSVIHSDNFYEISTEKITNLARPKNTRNEKNNSIISITHLETEIILYAAEKTTNILHYMVKKKETE